MTGSVFSLFDQIRCNNLLILSVDGLFLVNPTWSVSMILDKTFSKHRAKILLRILQSILIKRIGRQFEGSEVSLSFFGITDIKASSKDGGRDPFTYASLNTSVKVGQIYLSIVYNIQPETHLT